MTTTNDPTPQTGDLLFEAFIEQVRQVLEHLYDFAYLQLHSLARVYDNNGDLSAKTAGRQLRHELIKAIESLAPDPSSHFRTPDARLHELLRLHYVENLTIQETAAELGLSERQAYRDLKRGQETVAALLWDKRLEAMNNPPPAPTPLKDLDISMESEVSRLKLNFSLVDIGAIFKQAQQAVERLAQQQAVKMEIAQPSEAMILSMDPALAHQVLISVLSYAIQQAQQGNLAGHFDSGRGTVTVTLQYRVKEGLEAVPITEAAFVRLAQRLRWTINSADGDEGRQIIVRMASSTTTILVIDDNDGWIELLQRFLEGYDCLVVALGSGQDSLKRAEELNPSVIILDVMMPEKDGWALLQQLRARPLTANVPIIVCTVFNDPQLAFSLGASAFVSKPTNGNRILEALKETGVI